MNVISWNIPVKYLEATQLKQKPSESYTKATHGKIVFHILYLILPRLCRMAMVSWNISNKYLEPAELKRKPSESYMKARYSQFFHNFVSNFAEVMPNGYV